MKGIEAAKSADIQEGQLFPIKLAGRSLLLSRTDGTLCAIENKCPHLGLPLSKGRVADGKVTCPFHGSTFDLRSGANVDWVVSLGGKLPLPLWSRGLVALGRRPAPVATFPVSEEQGTVYVRI